MRIKATSTVDLFAEPQLNSKSVVKVSKGSSLELLESQGGWLHVRSSKQHQGWLREEKLPTFLLRKRAIQHRPIPMVSMKRVATIQAVISRAFDKQEDLRLIIQQRLEEAAARITSLNELTVLAQSYLRSTPSAGEGFSQQLRQFSFLREQQPIPSAFCGLNPNAFPGDIDGFDGRLPFPGEGNCFIEPRAFAALFNAIALWTERIFQKDQLRIQQWKIIHSLMQHLYDLQTFEAFDSAVNAALRVDRRRLDLQLVRESVDRIFGDFSLSINRSFADIQPISGDFEPGFPVPGFAMSGFRGFSICEFERWAGTRRALSCLCRETYRVIRILNASRANLDGTERLGEACIGDRIRLEGEGFGDERDWPLGLGQSDVLFEGELRAEILVTDYHLWSDTAIEFIVPPGIRSGRVSLRILCANTDSDCDIAVFRTCLILPLFSLIPPAGEIELRLGAEVLRSPYQIRSQRCEVVLLSLSVSDVEGLEIRDESGAFISVPEGELGLRRRVETEVSLVSNTTKHYSIDLFGGCGGATRIPLLVHRSGWLFFAQTPNGVMLPSERFILQLALTCPPQEFSRKSVVVTLTSSNPDLLNLSAASIEFGAEERVKEVEVISGISCGSAEIIARVDDASRPSSLEPYEMEARLIIGVIPSIMISEPRTPFGFGTCSTSNLITFLVSCLPPAHGELRIDVEEPSGRREWLVVVSEYLSDGSALVSVSPSTASISAGTYRFRLRVERQARGRDSSPDIIAQSNWLSLRAAEDPRPQLIALTATPSTWTGRPTSFNIRAEARFAQRLRLIEETRVSGLEPRDIADEFFSGEADPCDPAVRSIAATSSMDLYLKRFRLLASAFSGGDEVELGVLEIPLESSPAVEEETAEIISYKGIQIVNNSLYKVNVWWSENGGDFELKGTLLDMAFDSGAPARSPDSLTLEFETGNIYMIALIQIGGFSRRCTGDPSDLAEGRACLVGIDDGFLNYIPFIGDEESSYFVVEIPG